LLHHILINFPFQQLLYLLGCVVVQILKAQLLADLLPCHEFALDPQPPIGYSLPTVIAHLLPPLSTFSAITTNLLLLEVGQELNSPGFIGDGSNLLGKGFPESFADHIDSILEITGKFIPGLLEAVHLIINKILLEYFLDQSSALLFVSFRQISLDLFDPLEEFHPGVLPEHFYLLKVLRVEDLEGFLLLVLGIVGVGISGLEFAGPGGHEGIAVAEAGIIVKFYAEVLLLIAVEGGVEFAVVFTGLLEDVF
jgi:hypothetical protein